MDEEPKYKMSDSVKSEVERWNSEIESLRKDIETLFIPSDKVSYEHIHGGRQTLDGVRKRVNRLLNTQWHKLRDVWSEDLDKFVDEYKKWSELTKATKI